MKTTAGGRFISRRRENLHACAARTARQRHPHPFLRTDSVCVRDFVGDGLRRFTAQQFGYLVTFEMVTAMFCYIPVAHLADKYGRRPFMLITFLFFTLFPVTLLWAHDFRWLALAFVVRGLKEFGEPARKALIIGEAAPELRARTYGAYYLIRDCTVTSGSFLGAWLWYVSPRAISWRGHLRRAGNALVLVVYLPEEKYFSQIKQ